MAKHYRCELPGDAELLRRIAHYSGDALENLDRADPATVDTLITAGIVNSRAEVLRWAVGRIREHPAYAQLQERVHEVDRRALSWAAAWP